MSMSDESRGRSSDSRNRTTAAPREPGPRRSTLGGGTPTGLSGAMFGAGAKMPSYKPVKQAAVPQQRAPEPQKTDDPFGIGGSDMDSFASDPYQTDPFGMQPEDGEDTLTLEDGFGKLDPARAFRELDDSSFDDSADRGAGDASFDGLGASKYEFQEQEEYSSEFENAHGNGPDAGSAQFDDPYSDDPFMLETGDSDQNADTDDFGGDGQGYVEEDYDDYQNGMNAYSQAADLDEQPFELSDTEYDPSYPEGYRPATDAEIDEYIARARRVTEPAPRRPQQRQQQSGKRETIGRGAVQAFDAPYDQRRPEIALGGFSASRVKAPQQRGVARALEEGDSDASFEEGNGRKFQLNRGMVMIASAVVGAIALGGALAYAYRAGNAEVAGETPIVQAESGPVKVAPQGADVQPAGGSKLIYDRLGQDKGQAGSERIVPRQEQIAAANFPNGQASPGPVNATGAVQAPPLPGAADGVQPMPGADTYPPAQADAGPNGPRRVTTYVVRPDGTVVQPEPSAAEASSEQTVAAIPPAPEQSAAQPDANQAAAAPAPTAGERYVVQVGARKSQSEAFAQFADLQTKYPSLLGGYRPMVEKADLGDKGVWWRLRVGPMAQRTAAAKLCDDLKGAGLPSCLVMTE